MRFLSVLTIVLALAGTPLAHAAEIPKEVQLHYGVWGGGFQALDVHLRLHFSGNAYSAYMDAKPYGVLGKLLPWAGEFVSTGKIVNGQLVPDKHEKISAWREDQERTQITYKNGKVVEYAIKEKEGGKIQERFPPLDPKMTENTVDMVTAIVGMFRHATEKGNCDYRRTVFDGKRRFELTFKDEGQETLPPSKINIYGGREVRRCTLELIPLMGFKPGKLRGFYRIQEDSRKKGQLPQVWIGRTGEGGPYVPVRMLVKSEYGAVFTHIQNLDAR